MSLISFKKKGYTIGIERRRTRRGVKEKAKRSLIEEIKGAAKGRVHYKSYIKKGYWIFKTVCKYSIKRIKSRIKRLINGDPAIRYIKEIAEDKIEWTYKKREALFFDNNIYPKSKILDNKNIMVLYRSHNLFTIEKRSKEYLEKKDYVEDNSKHTFRSIPIRSGDPNYKRLDHQLFRPERSIVNGVRIIDNTKVKVE